MKNRILLHLKLILLCLVIGIIQFTSFYIWPFNLTDDAHAVAGATTVTLNSLTGALYQSRHANKAGAYDTWNNIATSTMTDQGSMGGALGGSIYCWSATQWTVEKTLVGFDLSTIPANAQIKSVQLITYNVATYDGGTPGNWLTSYITFYALPNHNEASSFNPYEAKNRGNIPLFQYKTALDFPTVASGNETFNLYSGWLNGFLAMKNSSNHIFFDYSFMRLQLNAVPDTYAGGHSLLIGSYANPVLKITYVTPPITRTVNSPTQGNIPAIITGNETADNITWASPRCAFADENLVMFCNGMPGANVTMRLLSQAGQVLASSGNQIVRDNSYYVWTIPPISGYTGYVQVVEDNFHLQSIWGYIDKIPAQSTQNLKTYAYDTAYPQYNNAFTHYVVWKDGVMFIYWSTNIGLSDLSNYNLEYWSGGDNTTVLFANTLTWLNTNYYTTNYTNNNYLAAYRYMIIAPYIASSGYNDRNGLIYNLNQDYSYQSSGFMVTLFKALSDNTVITDCHTAAYYLQNNDNEGLTITINTQGQDGNIESTINVGVNSKIPGRLAKLNVLVIDSSGNALTGTDTTVVSGKNTVLVAPPSTSGSYEVRYTFYDTTLNPYYSLVLDYPINYTATTAPQTSTPTPSGKGFAAWIKARLASWGMDDTAGHWIVIIVLCTIWAVAFGFVKHMPAVATVGVVLIFGIAIYIGWVDKWIIALLALAVGFEIFRMFRKKASGGTDGSPES